MPEFPIISGPGAVTGQDKLPAAPPKEPSPQPPPPPPPAGDKGHFQVVREHPMAPAQAQFQDEGLLKKGLKKLKDGGQDILDKAGESIKEIKEDYEKLTTLLSKPDLTSRDVREAAERADHIQKKLPFLVPASLPKDLNQLADHLAAAEKAVAASDFKTVREEMDKITALLTEMKARTPLAGDKLDQAIRSVEEKKILIDSGKAVTTRFDQLKDGDILDFMKNASNDDRKLLLFFSSEDQFSRLFKNTSYSIIFELYGGDDLASSIIEAAGGDLGKLQSSKLGVMSAYLCHGHTTDRDEQALIAIARTLDKDGLPDFVRGLRKADVDFPQLVEEIADHGLDNQGTLEALAALYQASATHEAERNELLKPIKNMSGEQYRRFNQLLLK